MLLMYWFMFGCPGWVLRVLGFSLVVASKGCSSLQCTGFSLPFPLLFRSTGSPASVVAARGLSSCRSRSLEHRLNSWAHELSYSAACEILLDQGSNPCLLRWQADSLIMGDFIAMKKDKVQLHTQSWMNLTDNWAKDVLLSLSYTHTHTQTTYYIMLFSYQILKTDKKYSV